MSDCCYVSKKTLYRAVHAESETNKFSPKKQKKIDIPTNVFYILQNAKYNQACHRRPIMLADMGRLPELWEGRRFSMAVHCWLLSGREPDSCPSSLQLESRRFELGFYEGLWRFNHDLTTKRYEYPPSFIASVSWSVTHRSPGRLSTTTRSWDSFTRLRGPKAGTVFTTSPFSRGCRRLFACAKRKRFRR